MEMESMLDSLSSPQRLWLRLGDPNQIDVEMTLLEHHNSWAESNQLTQELVRSIEKAFSIEKNYFRITDS